MLKGEYRLSQFQARMTEWQGSQGGDRDPFKRDEQGSQGSYKKRLAVFSISNTERFPGAHGGSFPSILGESGISTNEVEG